MPCQTYCYSYCYASPESERACLSEVIDLAITGWWASVELPFDRMINKQHESRSMFVLLQRLKSSAASWEALTGHFYFCTLGIVDRIIARPPLALPGNRSQFSPDLNLSNLFHTQSNLPKFLTSHLEAQSYVRIPKATGIESNSPSLFKVVHYIAMCTTVKFGENIPNCVRASSMFASYHAGLMS